MDPILLPRLLDAAHVIAREESLSVGQLREHLSCSPRRATEFLRVFSNLGFVQMDEPRVDEQRINSTHQFKQFVDAWNCGNSDELNVLLQAYSPYATFLNIIKKEERVPIPQNREEETELGARLHATYGLTFVGFDTLWRWAWPLSAIYVAHLDQPAVYWGGSTPSLDAFADAVRQGWRRHRGFDGFARTGDVAEDVCCSLLISFATFESCFAALLKNRPGAIYASGSAARPKQKKWEVQQIKPRSQVLLTGIWKGDKSRWMERRFLEDGILIKQHHLRVMQWRNETR